jgi:hypothetical protein
MLQSVTFEYHSQFGIPMSVILLNVFLLMIILLFSRM